jgi:2-polyprenyl-6-methoxyphenol hydroxylase-like FAD-dependent oxidoreductase
MRAATLGNRLKVMIVGAGTGGLCLAQGLKADGIAVEVFERDHSPTDRLQGYRLGVNATGRHALKECLPKALFDKLVASCANPSRAVTFLDHRLNRLLSIEIGAAEQNDLPVSRISLRGILLEGLDDVVRFGKKFTAFEETPSGAVTARFDDGSTATGDVLVGADGASSRVRRQLLPHAERLETGILAISGKIAMTEAIRRATPQAFLCGPTLVLGPKGRFMFGSAVEYRDSDDDARRDAKPSGTRPAAELALDREQYVMWGFSAPREAFAMPTDFEALGADDLKSRVLALTADWAGALRHLVEAAQPATVTAFPVKTSVPIPPWHTRRVTLVGDALHNMTPYRGIGANTALRDAAALRQALRDVDCGKSDLIPALADYEREMVNYGFRAVRESLRNMERFHAQGSLQRAVTKMFFRTIDAVPPLKAAFLRR